MIERHALLTDLQSLLRKLEVDLLDRSTSQEVPHVAEWLQQEFETAKKAKRTGLSRKEWLDGFLTQVAAAWVLSCVFVRFLEDNQLVDPPRIAGPGPRLQSARDEHTLFFQDSERAKLTDREYLLDIFAGLAKLPAGKDLFGPHNPMNALPNWLGPDAAGELLRFFQKIDSDSGLLVHDFTDPAQKDGSGWDTRFLGDLYQDVSEAARKKYALLQTPDFVEEFILDRTLNPALDEFGLTPDTNPEHLFKMIDPACGSGHFLLGSFPRILDRWQKREPGTNIRELVQRTLSSIHGVDINPFGIAIARFRLLLAALKACDIKRLKDAPAFTMNLACGDSLYHGVERQQTLGDWTDESHYFRTEDADNLRRILQEGTFHAVVANPPYITPKDKAANQAYRRLYPKTCHRQYALSVPFMDRVFGLGLRGGNGSNAGFNGQITANSFMKREFGKRLIEDYFPTVDLTCVIDTQLAHIPGHGIPTVILFGRNRQPVISEVRLIGAIKREDEEPAIPSNGKVWQSIVTLVDTPNQANEFISVENVDRTRLHTHPWSIGGGGASELRERIESQCETKLTEVISTISVICKTREDDAYQMDRPTLLRQRLGSQFSRSCVIGEQVRDFGFHNPDAILFPYDPELKPIDSEAGREVHRFLWRFKEFLWRRQELGGDHRELGRTWWEWNRFLTHWYKIPRSIAYAEVATHNHFCLDVGELVLTGSAPAIKTEQDSVNDFQLLSTMNSSVACFWLKQVCHCKGGGGIGGGIAAERWERFYAINGTRLKQLPLPTSMPPTGLGERLHSLARELAEESVAELAPSRSNNMVLSRRHEMIRLQEDLDWECYHLYGLLEDDLTYGSEESLGIQLGERAFEIVLARKMAAGEVTTSWFERHGSTPITEIPEHWPDDYKQLVQQRIDVIESNPQIALIEQPEYKRRWNTTPWEEQVEKALKSWLLDRLESYFDFDGRMNDEGKATAQIDISLISVAKLADIARQDEQFMEVAEVYRDNPAFDVQRLVEELVKGEHVPLLPVLRYKPNGLRNRAEWEKTWELQRLEDKLRAGEDVRLSDYELTDQQRDNIAGWQQTTPEAQRAEDRELDAIMSIPVPPKYKSSDFISSGGARYWALRGKLDVPKEPWVSFPHCEGPDGTLVIAWAGYDHLQLARAISAYFVDVQERLGGRDDPRLIPLLAGIIELLPWLKQWHHDLDPDYNQRMDEVFEGFVTEEAKNLGMTVEEIKAWEPPQRKGGRRRRTTTS